MKGLCPENFSNQLDDSNKTSHLHWYVLNIGIEMASSHSERVLLPSTGSSVLQQMYAVNNVHKAASSK